MVLGEGNARQRNVREGERQRRSHGIIIQQPTHCPTPFKPLRKANTHTTRDRHAHHHHKQHLVPLPLPQVEPQLPSKGGISTSPLQANSSTHVALADD